MEGKGLISQIFLLVCIISLVLVTHSVVIEMESYHHEFNPEIFKNVTIDLIDDGKRKVFNGSLITAIDINNYKVTALLKVRHKSGRTFTFFNVSIDGCAYLENGNNPSINLSYLILRDIRSVLRNVPAKCPVKKDLEISVVNLHISSNGYPLYIPQSPFVFILIVRIEDEVGYKLFVNGVVKPNRKRIG